MSKKILRRVRDELVSIRTNDIFVADAIKTCLALCEAGLAPRGTLPPHQWHSDTSAAAAIDIAPKFGRMTNAVLTLIARYDDGLTDEEGQALMRLEGNSYRPCRVTLADKGYVRDTDLRRLTSHRKKAVVWGITPAGVAYLTDLGAPV
jgi:hypothetical protein